MSPRFAPNQFTESRLLQAVFLSKLLLRDTACRITLSNLAYLFLSQLCATTTLALCCATTLSTKLHFCPIIAKHQVIWVNARGIIANMMNLLTTSNRAVVQFPRSAMGEAHCSRAVDNSQPTVYRIAPFKGDQNG
jgi:hypothetical protein